jgi:hypothetical protein
MKLSRRRAVRIRDCRSPYVRQAIPLRSVPMRSCTITIARASAILSGRSITTGEGAVLSWIDELVPRTPTPARLLQNLKDAYEIYCDSQIPRRRQVIFLGLHAAQRIAYWIGWTTAGHGKATAARPRARLRQAERTVDFSSQ